jgi:putative membrane protein
VLPSAPLLVFYAGVVSLFLSLASRGSRGWVLFLPTFVILILSVSAISSALLIADRKTIATFRRTTAVLLAGEILWLFCAACGIVYSWLSGSPYALTDAILFGAFLCAGLEFLVINGVFTGSAPLSLVLAVLHPAATLTVLRLSELSIRLDPFALLFGAVTFGIIAGFVFTQRRRKTSRGYNALSLFRAFMKTWVASQPAELEAIISDHAEDAEVTTKVLRFQTKAGDTFIVLPGAHPGPFHPVGSYDLPGVISRAFKGQGQVMTLHRPGGHERNLATAAETQRYADQISGFARTITPTVAEATSRGPLHAKIGKATVGSFAFSDDIIMTISFSPLGSDDLDAEVEGKLLRPGLDSGLQTSVVDAHNSIDSEHESLDTSDPRWREMFTKIKQERATKCRIAYSHSSELGFSPAGDLTENGVGLLLVEAGNVKSVLVLADANNAVPQLRGEVDRALEASGYRLIEFCTSDSHNLAARGLTVARGYQALGEQNSVESIVKLVVDLAKLAETRLLPTAYGSGQLSTKVRIFGSRALEEFATITQTSSRFGRLYLGFAAAAVGALLVLALVL